MVRRVLVASLALGGSAAALPAQSGIRVSPMAHAVAAATRADPTPYGGPLTEIRVVQTTLMAGVTALDSRLRLTATINLEGLTVPGGELTVGAWGEGFVDRRHPHTFVHELNIAAIDLLGSLDGSGRAAIVIGKGFVPFGTDDPMVRPLLKYPVNHHLAQILERAVAILQYDAGPVTLEAAVFNGDEPERPGQWPLLRSAGGGWRFGDSWSARATIRPLAALEFQGSLADVHSPEHRPGAGGDSDKRSLSARWHDATEWGERYALAEWARTSELGGFFVFGSVLAEGMLRRGRWSTAYRFEQTDRPEEERLFDPFRSRRPHIENSILGMTRWTLHTVRLAHDVVVPVRQLRIVPFIEGTLGRVALTGDGFFDVQSTYGSNRTSSATLGIAATWGGHRHRMGRYGVLAAPPMPGHRSH